MSGDSGNGGEGGTFIIENGGSGGSNGCVPTTCEALGKNCGLIPDGCGATIDCGTCAEGEECGLFEANVCGVPENPCVPATAELACANKQCGLEGDGCGGTIDCGTCPEGQTCGLVTPFQCAETPQGNNEECPARIESCAEVGAECGPIGNGCGGTLDCGTCDSGELCGLDIPYQCGTLPVCDPLDPTDPVELEQACADKCGIVSDGCGGTIDCEDTVFACPSGETCGGGGVANECGSGGVTCDPIPQGTACTDVECGAASDGCGSAYNCGTCGTTEICQAGECVASGCTQIPQGTACNGKECGQVGDGCGGTYTCGTCPSGEVCGLQAAFQCAAPAPQECQPLTAQQACAGKECGIAYDGCGTAAANTYDCAAVNSGGACPSGQFCGIRTPFQCDAPEEPPCVPNGTSCTELGWACGQAINNCGDVFDCASEGRSCNPFQTCTGGIDSPTVCTGNVENCALCDSVPSCAQNSPTRLTGRVVTPGRTNTDTANQIGVPNAFVYILRNNTASDLPAISTGIPAGGTSCDRCSEQDLGPVLASAVTDSTGAYTLEGNIPVGQNFLIVTKIGKFRRATTHQIPAGAACTTTALPTSVATNPTRLPRSMSDGTAVNIPRIAVTTGQIDAMECVFEKMGIAHSEFGNHGGSARIHIYRGGPSSHTTCSGGTTACSGARYNSSTPSDTTLYGSLSRMQEYDMVVSDCEGLAWDGTAFTQRNANGANVREYVNRGGRLFASHLSFSWLHQNGTTAYSAGAPISTGLGQAATWTTTLYTDTSGTGQVSLGRPLASPRIQSFADWMDNEGLVNASNQFTITDPRSMVTALGSSAEEFVFRSGGNGRVQQFSFNTPYAAPADSTCGRVAYSGFHVAATGGGSNPFNGKLHPTECTGNLTAQEKVLLYMLFDLGTCVGSEPEPPACVPAACPTDGTCGVLADGCGGQITCGCSGGQACVANECVTPSCVPTTCEAEGVICSSINDGCGQVLECDCPVCTPLTQQEACAAVSCGTASDGCSGVYTCSQCPSSCVPITSCPAGLDCGVISDGCSGTLNCGTCPSGQVCGAYSPNVCGTPECDPLSCQDVGATCGMIGDGCGDAVNCGTCPPGQTCTIVGGVPNRCAGCEPRTCQQAGAECGLIGDGCGGTVQCGTCPSGEVCGAVSPNQCDSGPQCTPQTCQAAGAQCGIIGDGCGGQVNCGACPSGQLCGVNTPFQCGPAPTCTPATCESLGAECGAVGDGCGAVLECGECPAGATCGLGEANKCRIIH